MRSWLVILLMFILLFAGPNLQAQHQPLISQYMLNKYLFNPALGGLKDQTVLTAGYRKQWVGIEGAPESYYFSGHTALGGDDPVQHKGLGGSVFNDRIGPLRTTTVNVSGSYHTLLSEGFHLSAGLSLGLMQRYLNVNALDPGNSNDPALYQNFSNTTSPFVGLGLWGFTDYFFTGISTIQSPSQEIQSELFNSPTNIRHYFANVGGIIPLWRKQRFREEQNYLILIPSFLLRYIPSTSLVYDLNMRMVYKDFLMAGASYRSTQDVVLQLGMEWQNKAKSARKEVYPSYFLSYSYDIGNSAVGIMSSGTHEVTLGIKLHRNRVTCPLIERSPTYFF